MMVCGQTLRQVLGQLELELLRPCQYMIKLNMTLTWVRYVLGVGVLSFNISALFHSCRDPREVRMVCVHESFLNLDIFMEPRYGLSLVLVQLGHDEAQNLLLQIRVAREVKLSSTMFSRMCLM